MIRRNSMQSRSSGASSGVEVLEHRMLCSAAHPAAAGYSLIDLLGYDNLGANWDYNSSYSATVMNNNNAGSGSFSTSVEPSLSTFGGHPSYVLDSSSTDDSGDSVGSSQTAWYANNKGTYLSGFVTSTGTGTFDLQLHNSLVAPMGLIVGGKAYRGAGTFGGTFNSAALGSSLSGNVSGTARSTSQLTGNVVVNEPAGTFQAIAGIETTNMTGAMSVRYKGQSYKIGFAATLSQTFDAVPGVGIVNSTQTISITISAGGQHVSASVNTQADLTDYSVP